LVGFIWAEAYPDYLHQDLALPGPDVSRLYVHTYLYLVGLKRDPWAAVSTALSKLYTRRAPGVEEKGER
jgi:hypothetical protein